MFDPHLYELEHRLQNRDIKHFYEKYKLELGWDNHEKNVCTLDIGSGDGSTTKQIVLPYVGGKVTGIDFDVSVKYAKKKHGSSNLNFVTMNITAQKIPEEFIEKFDHCVSNYCLHFVKKQSRAYININRMLKPNGDFFFVFAYRCDLFNIYKVLSEHAKWKLYLKDADFCTLAETSNLLQRLPDFLTDHGLSTKFCCLEQRNYTFTPKEFEVFIESACPFSYVLPKELKLKFCQEVFEEAIVPSKYSFHVERSGNKITKIVFEYNAIILHGQKISEPKSQIHDIFDRKIL